VPGLHERLIETGQRRDLPVERDHAHRQFDGLERLAAPGGAHEPVEHRAQFVERHLAERVPRCRVGETARQPELPPGRD
jgi:hypothetical protein